MVCRDWQLRTLKFKINYLKKLSFCQVTQPIIVGHKQKFTDLFKYLVDHPRGAFTPTSVLEKKMTALASFGIYTHNQMQEIPKPIFAKK
jgi:aspartyl/asparaginyl-tRNA synthetase